MNELDCRGLSCPEPVLKTRAQLLASDTGRLTVLVSSATARDNVMRLAGTMGWQAETSKQDGAYRIELNKQG